jgi:phosphatidylserine decarboxylase
MNNSIHRPEVCLPAQGHINVQGQVSEFQLADGRTLKMTRLSSKLPTRQERRIDLHYIHYYLFIGNGAMAHSHLGRNIQDILDRCIQGKVQSWAYFQAGTCWAPEIGVTEEEADKRLRKLISELLPGQIKWDEM